ncbi:MAG: chemotaxis protein CheW [Rhodobacteraceae bacterium]|uniref:chemotaxis protein CheW n=1 Tax=Amaricoccus sp. B4 TaxID=3368557 RepID=UPI000DAE703A|nr:chemotaxis protein CheW [Paracoccaceae bacterium]
MTNTTELEAIDTETRETDSAEYREIVSFRLSEQDFCIDIMNIREIRGWTPPTPLPHSPDYVRGLINLRGSVLPIVDLSRRLGLSSREATSRDVIIVVMVETQLIGLVVDGVSDILTVKQTDFQPTPSVGSDNAQGYVQGIMAIEGRMIRLLDLKRVFPTKCGEAA